MCADALLLEGFRIHITLALRVQKHMLPYFWRLKSLFTSNEIERTKAQNNENYQTDKPTPLLTQDEPY
jgi:hypothetical protein